jgi:monoamine oxidase
MPDNILSGSEPPGPDWISRGGGRWEKHHGNGSVAWPRVAVVGGGPSGLFATYLLNEQVPQAHVTIFEADNALGGKIVTECFADGTPFESGVAELYEYLNPDKPDSLRMLIEEELGLHTVNMHGGTVLLGNDILRDDHEFERLYGEEAAKQLRGFYEAVAAQLSVPQYTTRWQIDNSHPWTKKTFLEHLIKEVESPHARHYIQTAIHCDLATEPHTCNGLNAIKNALMDNKEYMQRYHVVGGIDRIVEKLEERLVADVRLYHRVTAVCRHGDLYRVCYNRHGNSASEFFDAVIVALPNQYLGQLCWDEDEKLRQAIENVVWHYDQPGHYIRITLRFDEVWWDALGIPGDYWMLDAFHGCCVYNENQRWLRGNCLSFLIAGQDALLLCCHDQSDECIVKHLLDALPDCMRQPARDHVQEFKIARYAGSVNAQPGGWPAAELRSVHTPDPRGHPALVLAGDYFFDSTLNGALVSAHTAVDLLLEHFDLESVKETELLKQLEPSGKVI